ncbi:DUF1798 family protein [Niallia sp. XMNu-256]|uniref:DUF1798 family protein n=1 Tax=Niallia sp. XMNu-256 TaxID=3082444 RepID=UPI0030CC997F
MENNKLIKLTNQLLLVSDQILQRFQQAKEDGQSGDFYQEVMPFSDKVQDLVDQWWVEVDLWTKQHNQVNIKQLINTKDQLEKIAIQAFYPQTSRKNFLDMMNSITFVLNTILDENKIDK